MIRRIGAGATLALLAAGCASVEQCDPNAVNNVFASATCGGAFEKRIGMLENQIRTIEANQAAEEAAARAARVESSALASERESLEREVASLDREIARLRLQSQGLKQETAGQKQIAEAMRRQVRAAEAELTAIRKAGGPSAAEVKRLQAVVDAKKDAYKALLDLYKTYE